MFFRMLFLTFAGSDWFVVDEAAPINQAVLLPILVTNLLPHPILGHLESFTWKRNGI